MGRPIPTFGRVPNVLTLFSGGAPDSLLSGLVAYYKLDEPSGTGVDATGRGNNLSTVVGAPLGVAGKIGLARQFLVATGQALRINSNTDMSLNAAAGDWTIAFWCNPISVTTAYLLSKGTGSLGEFRFYTVSNKIHLVIGNSSADLIDKAVTPNITTGWHNIAGRHNAAEKTITISMDNTHYKSAAYVGTPGASTHAFSIGALSASVGDSFNGLMDEVGLWKRFLSDDELSRFYG